MEDDKTAKLKNNYGSLNSAKRPDGREKPQTATGIRADRKSTPEPGKTPDTDQSGKTAAKPQSPLPETPSPEIFARHRETKIKTLSIDDTLIKHYVTHCALAGTCAGILTASNDELAGKFNHISTTPAAIKALEHHHAMLAGQMFSGIPMEDIADHKNPSPFFNPEEIKSFGGHSEMARFMALRRHCKNPQPSDQELQDALGQIPRYQAQLHHSCQDAPDQNLALLKLQYEIWKLENCPPTPNLPEKERAQKKVRLLAEKQTLLNASHNDSALTESIALVNDAATCAANLLGHHASREQLHGLAADLAKGGENSFEKEEKAFAFFPPRLRHAYRSNTMQPDERAQFWRQAAALTQNLTPEDAVKLTVLQTGVVARETAEDAAIIAARNTKDENHALEKYNLSQRQKQETARREKEQKDKTDEHLRKKNMDEMLNTTFAPIKEATKALEGLRLDK
ncbi:hypothetical protein OH491_24770 [Termitidicoccus mucosus]|uniref:Uncharacterized protein n=1 Tax=Termitidicoccus mucosus TaxID=1184151 RepID=A0A178IPM7_9BACT|nr:hypothetical protein AW736_01755 [Opitutaceae bacterium TSB47]